MTAATSDAGAEVGVRTRPALRATATDTGEATRRARVPRPPEKRWPDLAPAKLLPLTEPELSPLGADLWSVDPSASQPRRWQQVVATRYGLLTAGVFVGRNERSQFALTPIDRRYKLAGFSLAVVRSVTTVKGVAVGVGVRGAASVAGEASREGRYLTSRPMGGVVFIDLRH